MAERKTWVEVALNGPWSRKIQPRIPITVAEIVADGIASVKAGASVIHLHAYDEATGKQKDDPDLYARIIDGIRSQVDVIVYPTVPAANFSGGAGLVSAAQRYAHVEALAQRGLLEWAVVDPGSCNILQYDDVAQDKDTGFVYQNPESHIRHGLQLARKYRFHPSYAIYEPGFMRLGAVLHWRESCPTPIYRFMYTTGFTFGFPPDDYGMTAYLNLLDKVAPGAQWMTAGLNVDVLPMIPRTVIEGGHVRVGLEDAPFGSERSNAQWVEAAVAAVERVGGEMATVSDVRTTLRAIELGEA
ncbi:MAG: 3-keto-5-aminohexanoate cleavage protein [Betaproteobacteria bacterium]|nr:3-keto-5-aminohexanoate cleavage protein [Betaproteobacteria bacterium]